MTLIRLRQQLNDAMTCMTNKIEEHRQSLHQANISRNSERAKVFSEMVQFGEGYMLAGQATRNTVMNLHAALEVQDSSPDAADKEEELMKMLQLLIRYFEAYNHYPVSHWILDKVKSFWETYKNYLAAGCIVGAVVTVGGYIYSVGASCASLALALVGGLNPLALITQAVLWCSIVAVDAMIGTVLGGLLVTAACAAMEEMPQSKHPAKLAALRQQMERLRHNVLPTLMEIQQMSGNLRNVISLLDTVGHVCWFDFVDLTNCTDHPPNQHRPTCAVLPYKCEHPVCFNCRGKWHQCGLCKARYRN